MNDLNVVRQSAEAFGPQRVEPSTVLTERVLRETRSRRGPVRSRSTVQRGIRRHALWATPLATAAAVAAVVLIPNGGTVPAQEPLTAQSVLLAAATHARQTPVAVPPPGSYVYSRATGRYFFDMDSVRNDTPTQSESWLAVDGKRPGVQVETLEKGTSLPGQSAQPGPVQDTTELSADCPKPVLASSEPCSGPGYLADLPEDAAGAIAYLRKGSSTMSGMAEHCGSLNDVVTCRPWDDDGVFWVASRVLSERMMSAKSRAAIFEGMSTLTGVTVIPKATLAGHTGVGLSMTSRSAADDDDFQGTSKTLLVFDPDTDELVAAGTRDITTDGKLVQESSVAPEPLQVVTTLGVRPDGSAVKR